MDATVSYIVSTEPQVMTGGAPKDAIFRPSEYFVSTSGRQIAEFVLDYFFSFAISLFGVVANIMIMVVFSHQGFTESVNISMTFIAFWDFVKCLGGAMQRTAGPISLFNPAAALSWTNVSVVAFNYLISFSSYVSSALAAYVALERCLCVSIPFKVKFLLTPLFTFTVCMTISVVCFGSFSVVWGIYDVFWAFDPVFNTSVLIYTYNDFYRAHKGPLFEYYNLSGIIWPMASFAVIVVCTVIIVYQLQRSSSFRTRSNAAVVQSTTTPTSRPTETSGDHKGSQLSTRDRQVVKMLLVIIIVYVINLSPRIAHYTAKYLVYEFYFLRLYHNLFMVVCYFIFVFDLLNGAVNLFIFIKMSSSFRATFVALFPFCVPKCVNKE